MSTKHAIITAAATIVWLGWFYLLTSNIATPPVTQLRWFPPGETAFMARFSSGDADRTWVSLEEISNNLKRAVVIAEDDEFFEHPGVNIEAARKAARYNWRKRRLLRGASTITMQLAKNLYLTPRKSSWRKFREVLIALKLERELSKERILEIYLNVVEWGNGVFGAEAASRHYFNKNASTLTKREAAFLAAILPKPRFYDKNRSGPYLNRRISSISSRI
ncbi:MAG TPA: monofunctional biosynthetic peptidoglycan transglycosylase [bacterium]|nr:monofunctional biosynthetic peptidoglycan transglycosylase [bacterium]